MKRLLSIFVLLGILVAFSCGIASAAEEAKGLDSQVKAMIALASGIGIGIAAFGGALGQGKAIASALDGIGSGHL
jgi:F-type H+-transporting ATPase subunit c